MLAAGAGNCSRCSVKGNRFAPTDEELVDYHLRPKSLSPHSHEHYIDEIRELSQFGPQELFELTRKNPDDKEGYFFLRPTYNSNGQISRKGKNGNWNETCKSVQVIAEGGEEEIAEKRVFVFHEGVHSRKRTSWFIHQFELTAPLPDQQNREIFFLCKLFKQNDEKGRVSGKKRKGESNVPETARRRGAKDRRSRKKGAKVSSTAEAELGQKDLGDLASDAKNTIISWEEPHGIHSLPSDLATNILIGDDTLPQSHHLPSKDDCQNLSNNIHNGGHLWNIDRFHQIYGNFFDLLDSQEDQQSHHLPSKDDCQNLSNNIHNGDHSCNNDRFHQIYGTLFDLLDSQEDQQSHHLPSNSIINTSFYDEMQYPHSNMHEDNEDVRYKAWVDDASQLGCHMPSKNDSINLEDPKPSHHLPSNPMESVVSYDAYEETQSKQHQLSQLKDHNIDFTERDSSHHSDEFNFQELLSDLRQEPQSPMSSEVQSNNKFPPSDLNSNADTFCPLGNGEQHDEANFWNSLFY